MGEDLNKETKIGFKKGQMYSLFAHDGIKFIKVVFMFNDYQSILKNLHKGSKFSLSKGLYVSRLDAQYSVLVDSID